MQRRALIRVRDLAAFRQALIDRALAGDPLSARRRAILVPTRASAELLRQSIEAGAEARGRTAIVLPDLLTRDEWIAALHRSLREAPPLVTRLEREVLLERAARSAARRGWLPAPPFELRPGLVGAMLDLYDELRRRQRTVGRFARTLFDELRHERGTDRGSESLVRQTTFLGLAFLAYERLVAASGSIDEHGLRTALLTRSGFDRSVAPADCPDEAHTHVVVAVADHPADPRGLWPADFDLLGRLPGIAELDVVVTDETHDAGFRERIERELPGIEIDERVQSAGAARPPALIAPPMPETSAGAADADPSPICFVSRDREEELRDVARAIRRRLADPQAAPEPVAIVFHRPLPYLYLGRQVLGDARLPFQAFDALPLGAEPYAALLDLVLTFARTGGTREAAVALLRSRLLRFEVDGAAVGLRDASALDGALSARRATGEADSYPAEVEAHFGDRTVRSGLEQARARRAARAAADIREALQPFRVGAWASVQTGALAAFLRRYEVPAPASADDTDERDRQRRARASVLGVLDGLTDAFSRHDDARRTPADLVARVHHGIEAKTFAPRRGRTGVHLVDAMAARFGAFDHVHLVGLVETDWTERARRSIFYTSGLLHALGWPQDVEQGRAEQAAFRDLLGLASRTLRLHAFQLEGDSVVARSPLIEVARGRALSREDAAVPARIFPDEVLTLDGPPPAHLDREPSTWLALRRARPPLDDPRYGGEVAARAPSVYRVSKVDRFVDCPFKYFAESVLRLPEERDETAGLTPLESGSLVHDLFEEFYRTWHEAGHRTITPALLPLAVDWFRELAAARLAPLPEPDRVLESTRLVGSIVARGLAERVFELEADAAGVITDRLVETALAGPFVFPYQHGLAQQTIEIRGKADRIDVFDDGSLRVIDYKLGRLPDTDVSVQVGVYAHAAQAMLEARDGRPHPLRTVMYLAFGDDRRLEGRLGGSTPADVAHAVHARASDFAGAVRRIEEGRFPPRPREPGMCQYCRYAGVCRKEYRLDADTETSDERS